ncbi:hypothetical protein J2S10_002091 [Neobacillus ginsengisoli]|uniref:Uncharacterized protein n=1 Tax=Neobacillus ginsengisoli TaxID=904295 RepID=A0ABT9XTP6_9BACI|nr:hypothetical protein [Neobacillus ginsengisoli]
MYRASNVLEILLKEPFQPIIHSNSHPLIFFLPSKFPLRFLYVKHNKNTINSLFSNKKAHNSVCFFVICIPKMKQLGTSIILILYHFSKVKFFIDKVLFQAYPKYGSSTSSLKNNILCRGILPWKIQIN